MNDVLKLVLTDHWFEEIKSGRKTHEYRKATNFWKDRLDKFGAGCVVQFQKAYRKNPERMLFEIKNISVIMGKNTDLQIGYIWVDGMGCRWIKFKTEELAMS